MFTATIEIVLIATAYWLYWEFVDGLANRITGAAPQPQPQQEPTEIELTEALQEIGFTTEEIDEPHAPTPAPAPVRLALSTVGAMAINFEAMNAKELRKECASRKLKWRNVHGTNRHATRAEMLEMLQR